jgi:hypothetical protein
MATLRGWLAGPGGRGRLGLAGGGLVLFMIGFALGEWLAGPDLGGTGSEQQLRARIGSLETENRQAAEQIARLQTDARIDRETYAQVEEQLADLQGKIIEQQEELAFYRGIVGGPGKGGLRVQEFALRASSPTGVHLHFVLAQVERAVQPVRGEVQVRLDGVRAGRPASLDLASLAPSGGPRSLSFDFRYFQAIEVDLQVPRDFIPKRVVVRVVPTTGGMKPSVESFPWTPQRA